MPPVPTTVAPTLSDGTVTLRPVTPDDIAAVVEQSLDPETVRWTTVPPNYTEADARAFLQHGDEEHAAGRRTTWAVEHDGGFAGLVSLRTQGDGVEEVSFAGHPAHRGRGLVTAAVRLMCAYAFEHGAQVVLWHTLLGNFASRRVAWKAGFRIAADPVWAAGPPAGGSRRSRCGPAGCCRARRWSRRPDGSRRRRSRATGSAFGRSGTRMRGACRSSTTTRSGPTRPACPPGTRSTTGCSAQRSRSAAGNTLTCAVADATTDRLLGGVDIGRLDVPLFAGTGILGFWLLPDARGGGVVGKALELLIPYAWRPVDDGGLGLLPAHRRLRGRQPGVGSGAAASGVRARRHRATGHPGRRVGRRRPGVRPAGDRRPRRPTGPARPAPGDRDRAVPPAPLDVPGRPRRGRGSRPREPALHAAGRPPRRGDVPHVAAPAGARARTATSTSTGRSPTARPTTPSAT